MSIKSDKWIRRMAAEHGMIEPFEPGQVSHPRRSYRLKALTFVHGQSGHGGVD